MLSEYKDLIPKIKAENVRFAAIFEKHAQLDEAIESAESRKEHLDRVQIDSMKKEKLKLKDEAYEIILTYKKENGI
ncbi:MAG: DUF465 domain-containing protein [Sulfurospirillaceae bacterium]|jgi:uncharacterized protein YdcH (DUF465 family)|nr:DUF465 domain-containing protein [Sulfurospirillaceae bacterium]MCK9546567.1 DUF465 domain-containing protein [Sulfurospirillaceae bacterium]MDY0238794.1 DUF465 domain-containing protein [Campylobacterales bacterium]NLM99074.1 DUF465 domain-containing protein [Campylobacteraceae bacterium]